MKSDSITIFSIRHKQPARQYFLALFVFSSIFFLSFYSNHSSSKGICAVAAPTTTPTPKALIGLFSVELDRYTVVYPCPPGNRCEVAGDENALVTVAIFNANPKNNSFRYKYTISGGRIIGEGANVSWDLTNTQPGTYTITVSIANKSGKRLQAVTKQITVQANGIYDCNYCPRLSVDASTSPTQAGETMIFTAKIDGGSADNLTYNWAISDGEIIEGQGTPVIRVKANSKMAGKTVTATVEIGGVCEECPKTASASGQVAAKKDKDK